MSARSVVVITALLVLVIALLAAPAQAARQLRVQAVLAELPRSPPCDRRPITVTTRYRLERLIDGTPAAPIPADQLLFVVHRCPEFARGPSRHGRGTAPALRPGHVHQLTLEPLGETTVTIDPFSADARPRYAALRTDLAPEPPRVVVVVQGGVGTSHKLTFDDVHVTVGRAADADVLLSDARVALRHLRLDVDEERVIVRDLDTTQGTRVNGQRLRSPRPVTYKDKIEIGPYVLNVALFSPSEIRKSEEE
jgi:hypothetical protein